MTRKILLPMDGGQNSMRALAWYAKNFNAPEDELIFVYTASQPGSGLGGDVRTSDKEASDMTEVIAKAKALAVNVSERCSQLGVRAHIRFLERISSNPGNAIVELANEESVDVIVIGNRGISRVKRAFLGSISDYVLHHSHRTTIIVPPPKDH